MTDFLFALITFVLGYLFSRWVFLRWQGWGVTAFTTAYLLTVTAYLMKKGIFVKSHAAWFWMAVTWVTGASYTLWMNVGFAGIRLLLLVGSAVYYVIVASGCTFMGKTGNYLLIDGINAFTLIPLRNIINQYVSFAVLGKKKKRGKILPVLLGVLFALILAAILIPILRRADSGGFSIILDFIEDAFRFIDLEFFFYAILAIPIAAYIYGLISGVAHKKGTDIIEPKPIKETVDALRILQPATINIVLGAVCGVYCVFILSQIPYFFSAFTGNRPDGWLLYSEYARRGFFELSGIAVVNLIILTVGNLLSKKRRIESTALKSLNIMLAVITLLLIATAFSKMALYIDAYGLTMPRLLPCVLMVFMAIVFIALIVLQKRDFSIVRFALITGSIIVCVLSLCNLDAIVVRYNTDRYLSGTLLRYDTEILWRSGSAGILPAIEVYEATQDQNLKKDLKDYLGYQNCMYREANTQSLESYKAQKQLKLFWQRHEE